MTPETVSPSQRKRSVARAALEWLVSWCNGRRIGDVRYVKASPFIVGSLCHMLPPGCWTDAERSSLRYCCIKERWNGMRWEYVERMELSKEQWREILPS